MEYSVRTQAGPNIILKLIWTESECQFIIGITDTFSDMLLHLVMDKHSCQYMYK